MEPTWTSGGAQGRGLLGSLNKKKGVGLFHGTLMGQFTTNIVNKLQQLTTEKCYNSDS
jgi:hypothetical protein